jgi:hypothetical protein
MKTLLRIIGFVFVALGFLIIVLDCTRTIGGGTLIYTPIAETWGTISARSLQSLQPLLDKTHLPWLWDPVVLWVLLLPTSLVSIVIGLLIIRVFRARENASIGYTARP